MQALVVYVEILRGLEEILAADEYGLYGDYDDDGDNDDDDSNDNSDGNDSARDDTKKMKKKEKKKKNGEEDGNHPVSGGRRRRPAGRVQAMDRFLALAKAVVSGTAMLDGCYPVPEASGWYEFDRAFPCIVSVLESAAAIIPNGSPWFRREEVLMYWIRRPVGWTWAEDAPSAGSEDGEEGGDVWDLESWESDSVKSGFTKDS